MFHKLFKPEHYNGQEFFLKERKFLFEELWHFAGIKSCMNLGGNRFYSTVIAGKKIQLREYEGSMYALENICPHRGGPFVFEEIGEQPLTCKYHGLTFHANGTFKGSSSANWFCNDKAYDELDCLAIKKFRIKQVGEFIFVSLGDNVIFEDQFNEEMIQEMNKISFYNHFGRSSWIEEFNWK
jgi:phenylpropionate dioxygenase-like ring-hydroxylating dioxygenase large terminal subunit